MPSCPTSLCFRPGSLRTLEGITLNLVCWVLADPATKHLRSKLKASHHMVPHPSNAAATPWLKAQIDVYEMIINSLRGKSAQPSDEFRHALADVGQSSYRGAVCTQGTLPSISTSTRIYSFKSKRSSPQHDVFANFLPSSLRSIVTQAKALDA